MQKFPSAYSFELMNSFKILFYSKRIFKSRSFSLAFDYGLSRDVFNYPNRALRTRVDTPWNERADCRRM